MPEDLRELLASEWYYKIEIEPGVFTPGRERPNLALVRKLLQHVNVQDQDCIDIGAVGPVIP